MLLLPRLCANCLDREWGVGHFSDAYTFVRSPPNNSELVRVEEDRYRLSMRRATLSPSSL